MSYRKNESQGREILAQPLLTTQRLVLRPFTSGDLEDIFAYASDPEVARFTTWHPHKTLEDSRYFVEQVAFKGYEIGCLGPLAMVYQQKVIGAIELRPQADDTWELGYCLTRSHWGQGLMTEAANVVLAHALQTLGLQRSMMKARVDNHNLGSIKVLEKLGFELRRTEQDSCSKTHQPREMRFYSL